MYRSLIHSTTNLDANVTSTTISNLHKELDVNHQLFNN